MMNHKPRSRLLALTLAASMAVWNLPVAFHEELDMHVHAEEAEEPEIITLVEGEPSETGYIDFWFEDEDGNVVEQELMPEYENRSVVLPEKYDVRDYLTIGEARSQGSTGTCWAHSAMFLAEAYMMKNGYADVGIDYSETHLSWFTNGAAIEDESDPLYNDTCETLGINSYDFGGNYLRSTATLARGSGLQLEENEPYITERQEIDNSHFYTSYGLLTDCIVYDPDDFTSIKQAVMEYGGVGMAYHAYPDGKSMWTYLSKTNFAHFAYDQTGTNHAVAIVGWDDSYPKENFDANETTPENDGAWLVRNSWGSDFANDGYFWLSYEDPTIDQVHTFTFVPTGKYDKIYQYDGSTNGISRLYTTASIGNVFIAKKQEVLAAVSFWAHDTEVPYIISIYTDITDGNPVGKTLLYTQSGTEMYAGYHTVELNKLIEIESGEKFSVVVELDKNAAGFCTDVYPNATANGGGSYYAYGKVTDNTTWYDANTKGYDVCVKALTVEADPVVQVTDSDGNVKKYATLDAAINYAETLSESSEIKLLTDVSGSYEISAGNIIFNTGGYTLSGASDSAPALTISGGTVSLYSPVINNTNGGDAVKITGGSATIAGGTYTSEESGWALNIAGGSVNLIGGTFICSDDGSGSITASDKAVRSYVPVGYAIYDADGTVLVNYDSTANSLSETLRIASHTSHINGNYVDEGTVHAFSCIACGVPNKGTHTYTYYDNGNGTHSTSCTICSTVKIDEHEYGECTDNDDGTHKQVCSICNATLNSNHNFDAWSDNGDGTHSHFCKACNADESGTHNYSEWIDNKDGNHIRTCAECDSSEMSTHSYSEWYDNEDGTHSRFCSLCNSEDTAEHSYNENDWVNNGDGNHIHSCPDCGATEIGVHSMTDWSNVPSDNHHIRFCEDCAYLETDDHSFGSYADNGDGTHTRTCADCGTVESGEHNYGDWSDNGDGKHSRFCAECNSEESSKHNYNEPDIWVDNGDGTHTHTCLTCGAEETSEHDFGECMDNDNGTHTHYCNHCSYSEINNHDYGQWSDNGDGTQSRTCSSCGSIETTEHSFSDWYDNGDGTHSRACADCGVAESTDHSYTENDWRIQDDSTHTRTCPDCGATETGEHILTDWTNVPSDNCHIRFCETCAHFISEDHNFGSYVDNGDGTHSRTCADCDVAESTDHSYSSYNDNGNGTHTGTCECGYISTETHEMGNWLHEEQNSGEHTRYCSYCIFSETEPHTHTTYDVISEEYYLHGAWCNECMSYEVYDCTFNMSPEDNGDGTHSYKCICGNKKIFEHAFDDCDWVIHDANAHIRNCPDCGATETGKHNFSDYDWVIHDDSIHIHTCPDCGATETGEHVLGDWKNSTYYNYHIRFCKSCTYSIAEDHNFGSWSDNGDGTHIRTCRDCGTTETGEHTLTDWTNAPSDNCHIRYCETCAHFISETHNFGSCTDNGDGTHTRTCRTCSATEITEHIFVDWIHSDADTHIRFCENCSFEESEAHTYSAWTDNGIGEHERYCDICSCYQFTAHVYGEWIDNGDSSHISYCNTCDNYEIAEHDYGEWIDNGDKSYTHYCRYCGASETCVPGDMNNDGRLNVFDLTLFKKFFLTDFPDRYSEHSADINRDSVVDESDIKLLQQYISGVITSF